MRILGICKKYVFSLLLFAVFTGGAAQSALALTVNDIRIGLHPDKSRVVLEMDRASKFRAFVLDSPWRLVIDLPEYSWQVSEISKPVQSGINAIRQGQLKPGFSRIVLDLDHPVSISSAFILRAHEDRPNRLVIDFNKVGNAAYLREKGKVHGILELDSAPGQETRAQPEPAAGAAPPVRKAAAGTMVVPEQKPQPKSLPLDKPVVIIDPGHGGVDPGAIGANGVFEKHITLALARDLKRELESAGKYTVYLTRNSDKYLRLYQRVDFARKNGGDLFISLHADSLKSSGVRGASVYTLSEKASDEQTARLAERENQADLIAGVDLSHEDEQVATILVDLAMRDTMNQSKFFANTLVGQMQGDRINLLDNPHRYAGFAVLKAPDIPSVLVEAGFLSNRREAELLAQPPHRRKIARALKAGIDVYFEKVRRNNRI